jgi:protein-tyrosine phosphatase
VVSTPPNGPIPTSSTISFNYLAPGPKKVCETLPKKNLVHVIASDAHDSGRRSPVLSESRKAAAKIVGDKHATALVSEIPAAIVRGELL